MLYASVDCHVESGAICDSVGLVSLFLDLLLCQRSDHAECGHLVVPAAGLSVAVRCPTVDVRHASDLPFFPDARPHLLAILKWNRLAPIFETARYGLLGAGNFSVGPSYIPQRSQSCCCPSSAVNYYAAEQITPVINELDTLSRMIVSFAEKLD